MTQKSVEQKSRQVSDYLSKCPKSEWAILDEDGNVREWKESFFGVSFQITFCSPSIAMGAISAIPEYECPSLGMFYNCFQFKAIAWLAKHIDILNTISSAQNKLNDKQIKILAMDIFTQYYYWNLGDVCVFFGKVRRGQYGHFYGTVDNLMIMEWAKAFDKERRDEIERWENAVRKEKMKEAEANKENTISEEEYLATLSEEQKQKSFAYMRKMFNVNKK